MGFWSKKIIFWQNIRKSKARPELAPTWGPQNRRYTIAEPDFKKQLTGILYDLRYVLVFLGRTWKDGGAVDIMGFKGVYLGRGTDRSEVVLNQTVT